MRTQNEVGYKYEVKVTSRESFRHPSIACLMSSNEGVRTIDPLPAYVYTQYVYIYICVYSLEDCDGIGTPSSVS